MNRSTNGLQSHLTAFPSRPGGGRFAPGYGRREAKSLPTYPTARGSSRSRRNCSRRGCPDPPTHAHTHTLPATEEDSCEPANVWNPAWKAASSPADSLGWGVQSPGSGVTSSREDLSYATLRRSPSKARAVPRTGDPGGIRPGPHPPLTEPRRVSNRNPSGEDGSDR